MFAKRKQEWLAKMGLDPATLQQAAGRVQAATTALRRRRSSHAEHGRSASRGLDTGPSVKVH
jgi:hypothetical protein